MSLAAGVDADFKAGQRLAWAHFGSKEGLTIPVAARLVGHARVRAGQRVLDVACGTGVVAVTAARRGAVATGLDLTPALLEKARENAVLAEVEVEWLEGDVEQLPFRDDAFDVVVSQFGHIFAPDAERATREMLRVLRPGGTLAFASWPPHLMTARMFELAEAYAPRRSGLPGVGAWGDPAVIRARLGAAVEAIAFGSGTQRAPALSPQHYRQGAEKSAGPVRQLAAALAAADPGAMAGFRRELEALAAEYMEGNTIRQDYLLTRACKCA